MAPSIDGLTRAAQYYDVSTDFLLGLTGDSDPRPDWLTLVDQMCIRDSNNISV